MFPHAFDVCIVTAIGVLPILSFAVFVPCPDIICQSPVTCHVYSIAPGTVCRLKFDCVPIHAGFGPVICIGVVGDPIEYAIVFCAFICTVHPLIVIFVSVIVVLSVNYLHYF